MIVRALNYKVKPGKMDEYLVHIMDVMERTAGMEGMSFFKLFQDREDPDRLFIFQIFESEEAVERYSEVGPNKEYTDTVMPLIEEFTLAQTYDVREAKQLF